MEESEESHSKRLQVNQHEKESQMRKRKGGMQKKTVAVQGGTQELRKVEKDEQQVQAQKPENECASGSHTQGCADEHDED